MELQHLTDEDMDNIKELLMDPINFPTYSNSESLRYTFKFLFGLTVFEFFIYLILLLLGSKWRVIFFCWLIIYISFLLFYKFVHLRFVKSIPKRLGKARENQVTFIMKDNTFSSDKRKSKKKTK